MSVKKVQRKSKTQLEVPVEVIALKDPVEDVVGTEVVVEVDEGIAAVVDEVETKSQ